MSEDAQAPKTGSGAQKAVAAPASKTARRRRLSRLAIYDRLPDGLGGGTAALEQMQHVVVDLSGKSADPEVFTSKDLDEARGFVAGAVWAGRAEAVS